MTEFEDVPSSSIDVLMVGTYRPDQSDGASYSARNLVKHVRARQIKVKVMTTDNGWDESVINDQRESDVQLFRTWFSKPLEFAPGLLLKLLSNVLSHHVTHYRGIFSINTVCGSLISTIFKRPYVISLVGDAIPKNSIEKASMKSGNRKLAFFHILIRPLLNNSDMIVCTSRHEATLIEPFVSKSKISIVPDGLETDEYRNEVLKESLDRDVLQLIGTSFFLYLGRMSSEKNLLFLLSVWEKFTKTRKDVKLVLAGHISDHNYWREVKRFIDENDLNGSVCFLGPVYGAVKYYLLQNALALLLPSHRESFGIVVLEALAAGTLPITSRGTDWQILEDENLGYCLELDEQIWISNMKALENISSEEKFEFRNRASHWVSEKYSWDISGEKYTSIYKKIIE